MRPIGRTEQRITQLAVRRAGSSYDELIAEWRLLRGSTRGVREVRAAIRRVLRLRGVAVIGRGPGAYLYATSDLAILRAAQLAAPN